MSRARLLPLLLLSLAAAGLGFVPGCSSDNAAPAHQPIADVERQGAATLSELQTFADSEADDWDWAGGQFDAPKDMAVLASDAPFAFTWHSASTEPPTAGAPDQFEVTYLLVFSTPSQANLLRIFTTLNDYTPDAAAWQKLVSAGEAITLSVTSGTFSGSALTADGGPHRGQSLTFTIQ